MPFDVEDWYDSVQRRQAQRLRACQNKRWFETEAQSRAAALWDRTQFGERRQPYRCDICDGWHLTSVPSAGR